MTPQVPQAAAEGRSTPREPDLSGREAGSLCGSHRARLNLAAEQHQHRRMNEMGVIQPYEIFTPRMFESAMSGVVSTFIAWFSFLLQTKVNASGTACGACDRRNCTGHRKAK